MCKKIKDILHIFNIKGNDRKSVSYSIADVPLEIDEKTINISWIGERMVMSYTEFYSRKNVTPNIVTYTPKKTTYTDGDGAYFQVVLPYVRTQRVQRRPMDDMLYFDCTNVTSLIVNGDVLI